VPYLYTLSAKALILTNASPHLYKLHIQTILGQNFHHNYISVAPLGAGAYQRQPQTAAAIHPLPATGAG